MIHAFLIKSFLLMLVVGLVLPSDGNHGLLAPKSLTFITSAFFFTLYFISRWRLSLTQVKASLLILISFFFFGVWYVVGINQDPLIPSGQFDQFKVFMTTFFVPFSAWYLVKEKLITPQKILRIIIVANLAYSFTKVLLMILHLFKIINVWTVMHLTGFRYMSMHIVGEVGRIQTSVDIITPYLVYFLLQSENLGIKFSKKFKAIYLIISFFSVILSFSRLLIFVFGMSIILHALTLPILKQVKLWIVLIFLAFCATFAIGPEKIGKVIEKRFFSEDNYQSDATRRVQIDAMINACDESPILGKGLGGYTTECIRDFTLPHAYEVQWVAFLMQFGILGITFILIPLVIIAMKILTLPLDTKKIGYFLLFGLWLISGFTNPFLISLTSGIAYMMFLLTADCKISAPTRSLNSPPYQADLFSFVE